MEIKKKGVPLKLIFLGLLIRLAVLPLPGFRIDVDDWVAWTIRLSHFNFAEFYSKSVFTDYTPGYLYILSLLGFLKNLFQIDNYSFYLLLKIPAVVSELLIGILVYKEIKACVGKKVALLALCFILFNPSLIFNSSIWGQIDSILSLLMLVTIITLKNNNIILTSIFFGLAVLIKPQAIALMPLLILAITNHFKLSNLFKLLVPGLVTVFILTVFFFPQHTLTNLIEQIANTANGYAYTSLNAYNLWGAIGFWIPDSQIWNGLTYQAWGYILLSSYWIILGYFYFKKKLSIYALATLATLGFFFLPTRVHERYLYPAIIFLILLAAYLKSRLLLVLTGALSMLHLFNLYYVYVYYNEFYFKLPKVLYNPIVYSFLGTNGKSLSLLSTAIFIFITIVIIKYHDKSKEN